MNRPWHEVVQMLRGLKVKQEEQEEDRDREGRVTEVRNVAESASATDAVTVTERAGTELWTGDWGTSEWGDSA